MKTEETKNNEIEFLGLVVLLMKAQGQKNKEHERKIKKKIEEVKTRLEGMTDEQILKGATETVFSRINGGH
jgi:hypothetical protein